MGRFICCKVLERKITKGCLQNKYWTAFLRRWHSCLKPDTQKRGKQVKKWKKNVAGSAFSLQRPKAGMRLACLRTEARPGWQMHWEWGCEGVRRKRWTGVRSPCKPSWRVWVLFWMQRKSLIGFKQGEIQFMVISILLASLWRMDLRREGVMKDC